MTSVHGFASLPYRFGTNYVKFRENLIVTDNSRLFYNGEYVINSSLFINGS